MRNYEVREIGEHTWQIEDKFKTYLYLVEGEQRAMLIDAGNGFSGLLETVEALTQKPVFVLLTHGHFDHTSCAGLFENCFIHAADRSVLEEGLSIKERAKRISHFCKIYQVDLPEKEQADMISVKKPENIQPLSEGQVFDLGDRTLEIIETPGHTRGSVCVLDRKYKFLFSGDTVCNREILVYFDHSASVEDVKEQAEKLLSYQDAFYQIWPGHHECPLDVSIVKDYCDAAEQILTGKQNGRRISLEEGYKILYSYKSIGISYTEEHIKKRKR